MRIRTRNSLIPTAGTLVQEQYYRSGSCSAPLSWYTSWTGNYAPTVGTYESMADVVIPGYSRKSQRGEVFFNPMSRSKFTIDAGYGSAGAVLQATAVSCTAPNNYNRKIRHVANGVSEGRVVCPASGFDLHVDGQLVMPASILSTSEIRDLHVEASTECLAERGTADSNQWEALAELNKSLAMANQAMGHINDFLAGSKGLLSKSKAIGNCYLLYRYGFTPLMASLETATEGVFKATGRIRNTSRGKASMSKTMQTSSTVRPYNMYDINLLITTTEEYAVRAMSLDELDASFASNIGFTTKGLMQLPWELLPYSFVADWFVNIGDVYGSLLPTLGTKGLGSCLVVERSVVRRCDQIGSAYNPISGHTILTQPHPAGYSCSWYNKSRTPGLPNPGLVIRADFKFDMNHKLRIMDGLSLVLQRLK